MNAPSTWLEEQKTFSHSRNFMVELSSLEIKKENIEGIGKNGRWPDHAIKNMYFFNVLKYSLLSVSQIYDRGNKVKFKLDRCTVTNISSGEVILKAKGAKISM